MPAIDIHRFNPQQAEQFASMTFPAYRHLLNLEPATRHLASDDTRIIQPLAVAASLGGQPAGLALAELPIAQDRDQHSAELLSVFVDKTCRGHGLGKALLGALESLVAEAGLGELAAVYMRGKPSIDIVERLLAQHGWSEPEPRMVTVKFMVEELYKAAWLHRYAPRAGYEIFSWMDLRDAEREEIRRSHETDAWIAPDLVPWKYDSEYEPTTSVGMRFEGKVVGWVINHRLDDQTVRYTCSFMRRDLQGVGAILPLYCESFRRLHRFGFKRGMFVAPLYHPQMAKFSRRWFGPWSYFIGETMGSRKQLAQPSSSQAPAACESTAESL